MSEECRQLHELFNSMTRFNFPFDEKLIPLNGIYVLFEKGEKAHGLDRIVRIGTHTGFNQLPSRLYQHFVNENKDRSIFRKNIGRALLNKENDSFLVQWNIDLTAKEARQKHVASIDLAKLDLIEKKVSKCLQENFSFVVFEVKDKKERLSLEAGLISTVSLCEECQPSKSWLGLFSPKEKIRESGLWLEQELYKKPLTERDLLELKRVLG